MTRDDLIRALGERYPTIGDREDMSLEAHADWLIATWEPLIRADEREQYDRAMFSDYHRDWDAKMADLRAKVEALPIILYPIPNKTHGAVTGHAVDLDEVLALLDGGSDDPR